MARQGWGRHSTVATGSDSGDQVSVNAWNADTNKAGMLGFTGETIASATSITPTNSTIILSGSTNVSTIAQGNSAEYDLLYVFTSGSVTLVNTASPSSAGDIKLLANANKDLSSTVPTILIRKGTAWYEYGGGITNSLDDIGDVVITSVANEDVLAYDSVTSKWINQSADETGRVTADSTTTFTNKSIDQDGTGNFITNIADASIKASAAIAQSKIANLTTDLSGKSPTAGNTSLVTTGALDTGSITSGFGNINIGSSTFTTTGAVATGAITAGGTITGDLTGNVTGNTSGSSGSTTGNAATSTTSTNVTVTDESTDTSCNVLFTTAATGALPPKSGTNLTFNSNTGILTATGFAGPLTGNVTGNASGSSGSTTGNAATATALATARTIGGTSFDGTANISVALAATSTALATARTIGGVSFDGTANITLPGVDAAGNQNTTGTAAGLSTALISTSGGTGLTSYTAGDILYYASGTTLTKLAKGTASQQIRMNSGATAPEWFTPTGGSDTPWTEHHDFDTYYFDMQVQSAPANPAASNGRVYLKTIDSNNDGLFIKVKKNGGFQEVQIA